jgi:hypothetical protein
MSAEKEKERPAMKEPDALSEATSIGDTVIYGLNGRCSITFTEPAPAAVQLKAENQPEDCFAVPQRSKHWRDTLRHGDGLRWKRNPRSSR